MGVKCSPMGQLSGCNVISFCLIRKEETTLNLYGNTAVDHFFKRVWKNKRLKNLTAEIFLMKITGRDGSLKSHGWQTLGFGSVYATSLPVMWPLQHQNPPTAFPSHSHSAGWEFPTVPWKGILQPHICWGLSWNQRQESTQVHVLQTQPGHGLRTPEGLGQILMKETKA